VRFLQFRRFGAGRIGGCASRDLEDRVAVGRVLEARDSSAQEGRGDIAGRRSFHGVRIGGLEASG